MFNFCPSCASKAIFFEKGKLFRCPGCGFHYYHNIAAATGCVISIPDGEVKRERHHGSQNLSSKKRSSERILFTVRGKEPAKGKLDLPGGFVDHGEGVLECLYRELKEEIGWAPIIQPGVGLSGVFKFFASFSNVYPYKNIVYNTCDLFFTIPVPGLRREDLKPQAGEIAEIRFVRPGEIDPDDLAFDSTRRAIRAFQEFILPR